MEKSFRESLIKSFDRLRTSGNILTTYLVSLSNHGCNQFDQTPSGSMEFLQSRFQVKSICLSGMHSDLRFQHGDHRFCLGTDAAP